MVGKCSSTLRYMDVAVRRNEGKLCFVKRKSKDLVSNYRRFCEKNISIFEKRERLDKNLWTFLRNAPSFLFFLPIFWGNDARSFPLLPFAVSSSAASYARTDTPPHIAHSASSKFLPSPFTLHLHHQVVDTVRVVCEEKALFLPSPVKEKGGKPSHASRCFRTSYPRMVKR